jgi:hypothetical protein
MWESPISIIHENIKFEVENEVVKAVYKYGIDVDKDRLLEMLRGDSRSYDRGYATGKREVCVRIIERLREAKGLYIDENGRELFQEDYFIDIDEAIEIVRSEM